MKYQRLWLLPILCLGTLLIGQNEEITIQFSDPSQPGILEIRQVTGGITVKGHSSSDIVISFPKAIQTEEDRELAPNGMRRIRAKTPNLKVEEMDNKIEIHSNNWSTAIDIQILVPFQTSLTLSCMNEGDILVENVKGELEVKNLNGNVTLREISGSVIAHSLNENLRVIFAELDPNKPMSFTSLNGNVDITFPPNLSAKLLLETNHGDIFTSFDIELKQEVKKQESKQNGRRRIAYKSQMIGIVGNGGPEMTLKTFNGNIYIRKADK